MPIALIFTNDWELFGDGTGDYYEVQHRPMLEMLDIMDRFGAKLSIMAEVMQHIYYQKYSNEIPDGHKITSSWESLLKEAIKRGHDVQLHIHPQWLDANYSNGKWNLDMSRCSIASLDIETMNNIIETSKNLLERLITVTKSDYKCLAFRAGGYMIEPSQNVIKALKSKGILCDTSVTKGYRNEGLYDFTDAYSNISPWFTSDTSVKYRDNNTNGLLEMPIHSVTGIDFPAMKKLFPKLYYKFKYGVSVQDSQLEWLRERERIKNLRYPKSNRYYKNTSKKNLKWFLNAIATTNAVQLDYDYLPAAAFVKIIENVLKSKTAIKYEKSDIMLPVIASGHIKDIQNCDNIKMILQMLKELLYEKIHFWTLTDAVNYWYGIKNFKLN